MGRIVISEHVSLDGVVQDPIGDEGFGRGGWFQQMSERDRDAWAELGLAEALAADALLLGRRSDEFFAERWRSRSGAWADRLNSMPKYVISSTLNTPKWTNSTVLRGDVVKAVSALRQELNGDIVIYASIQLAKTLMDHDLADELRLIVHPVVLGAGERLFRTTSETMVMRPTKVQAVGDRLAFLAYQPVRAGDTPESGEHQGSDR